MVLYPGRKIQVKKFGGHWSLNAGTFPVQNYPCMDFGCKQNTETINGYYFRTLRTGPSDKKLFPPTPLCCQPCDGSVILVLFPLLCC